MADRIRGIIMAPQPSIAVQPDPHAMLRQALALADSIPPMRQYEIRGGVAELVFFLATLRPAEPDSPATYGARLGPLSRIPTVYSFTVEPLHVELVDTATGQVIARQKVLEFEMTYTPPPTEMYLASREPLDFDTLARRVRQQAIADVRNTDPRDFLHGIGAGA